MSGHEKFYIPHDDLVSLEAAMASLETATEVLQAAIEVLSSKYVTPENIANVITGYTQLFVMVYLGASDDAMGFTGTYGITFDGTDFYGYDGTDIIKWNPGGTQTVFVAAPPKNVRSFAWDKNNERLYAGENDGDTYGSEEAGRLLTYDSDGNLLYNVGISNPVLAPKEENILGLAYDYDNSKLYVLYWGPTYDIVRYGVVDPTTGTITEQVDLNNLYAFGLDMCYSDGILHILMSDRIVGFRVGDAKPIYRSGLPTTAPDEYFTHDEDTKIFYFANDTTSTIGYNGLSHVQRSHIQDFESTADLDTIETTLTNLEKALQSINTDYLKVQHRDAADNLMPSGDAIARPIFVRISDGNYGLALLNDTASYQSYHRGLATFGYRVENSMWRALPSAVYSDTLANKGANVVPVTPMTAQREEGTKTHTNDSCFVVSYEVTGVEAKTGYVLIDLSNATNYPHTEVNEIHVDWIAFSMLGDVSAEGHVHIGFISAIDADKGTMICFVCKPADKIARSAFVSRQYNPSAVRCKTAAVLAGGGMKIVDDTTFQNDVALAGTYEAVIPAVGDLVMLIDRVAGTFDTVSVAIGYHTI